MADVTTSPKKRLLCRMGIHKYVLRVNDEGGRFHECRYCRHFDPRSSSSSAGGGLMM